MKTIYKFLFGSFFTFGFLSCDTGYQFENEKWVWVSYNESVGRNARELMEVDNKSFKILRNKKYARDDNRVYFEGTIIKNADPKTFELISGSKYAKDNRNVYLDWVKVLEADPASFKPLEGPYAYDNNHVFCGTIPIKSEHPKTLEIKESTETSITTSFAGFLKNNPEFDWIDTDENQTVIYVFPDFAKAETRTEKFNAYRKEPK